MTIMKSNMIFSIWTNSMNVFLLSNAYGKVPQSIGYFFESSKIKQKQSLLKNVWYSKEPKGFQRNHKEKQSVPKKTKLSQGTSKIQPKGSQKTRKSCQGSFKNSTQREPKSKKIIQNHRFFFIKFFLFKNLKTVMAHL